MQLLARAANEYPETPTKEAMQNRSAAYAYHAYGQMFGEPDVDNPIDGEKMLEAALMYGVHLVDLLDRMEWALDNALAANAALQKSASNVQGFRNTKRRLKKGA